VKIHIPSSRKCPMPGKGTAKYENGPLARVRVRRPVWAKGEGYGQRFKAE
jgi:hypothetical protein